jgi:hypothetical protein
MGYLFFFQVILLELFFFLLLPEHIESVGLQAGYPLPLFVPFFLPHGTNFPFLLFLQSIQPFPLFLLNHPRKPSFFSNSNPSSTSFAFAQLLKSFIILPYAQNYFSY